MEELDYRVWHIESQEMYRAIGAYITDLKDGRDIVIKVEYNDDDDGALVFPYEECLLLRFSGVTDSKNNKIYEGDIIETNDGRENVVSYDEYIDTHEDYPKTHLGWTVGEKTLIDAINDFDGKVISSIYTRQEGF